jgi:hypothetical protein
MRSVDQLVEVLLDVLLHLLQALLLDQLLHPRRGQQGLHDLLQALFLEHVAVLLPDDSQGNAGRIPARLLATRLLLLQALHPRVPPCHLALLLLPHLLLHLLHYYILFLTHLHNRQLLRLFRLLPRLTRLLSRLIRLFRPGDLLLWQWLV